MRLSRSHCVGTVAASRARSFFVDIESVIRIIGRVAEQVLVIANRINFIIPIESLSVSSVLTPQSSLRQTICINLLSNDFAVNLGGDDAENLFREGD